MKCEVCKQPFTPGVNGVAFGKAGVHDACGGFTRDAYGYMWTRADIERGYIELTNTQTGEKIKWLWQAPK